MRKILWAVIILVCLIPVAFISMSLIKAAPKKLMEAQTNFVAINHQYIDNKTIDTASFSGDDANAKFVRIFAEYLNKVMGFNSRLAQVKNNLYVLAQAANQTSAQGVYELQEKEINYEKEIISIQTDREAAVQELLDKTSALDRKQLKIVDDIVAFGETLHNDKAERDKEIQQYMGLAQYIKSMLDFIKSRTGAYQATPSGSLSFTRPDDQQYYAQLVAGVNKYGKMIDDLREQNNASYRKWVNDLTLSK